MKLEHIEKNEQYRQRWASRASPLNLNGISVGDRVLHTNITCHVTGPVTWGGSRKPTYEARKSHLRAVTRVTSLGHRLMPSSYEDRNMLRAMLSLVMAHDPRLVMDGPGCAHHLPLPAHVGGRAIAAIPSYCCPCPHVVTIATHHLHPQPPTHTLRLNPPPIGLSHGSA